MSLDSAASGSASEIKGASAGKDLPSASGAYSGNPTYPAPDRNLSAIVSVTCGNHSLVCTMPASSTVTINAIDVHKIRFLLDSLTAKASRSTVAAQSGKSHRTGIARIEVLAGFATV